MQSEKKSGSPMKTLLRSALDAILIPFLAILRAVVLGGVIIAIVRGNPFLAYYGLIDGSFGSAKALSETAVWATQYIFGGLAVALAFKGGLFNIGAEGQLALGATVSALIGYALPEWLWLAVYQPQLHDQAVVVKSQRSSPSVGQLIHSAATF